MTVVAVDDRAWPDDTHRRTPSLFPRWMAYALDPGDHTEAVRREVDAHLRRHPRLAGQRRLLDGAGAVRLAGEFDDIVAGLPLPPGP